MVVDCPSVIDWYLPLDWYPMAVMDRLHLSGVLDGFLLVGWCGWYSHKGLLSGCGAYHLIVVLIYTARCSYQGGSINQMNLLDLPRG